MHARQRVTCSSFTHPLLPILAPRPLPASPERSWSAEDWATVELGYEAESMEENLLELVLSSYLLGQSVLELRGRFQEVSSR